MLSIRSEKWTSGALVAGVGLGLLMAATTCTADDRKHKTEAEQDGLAGPVKSVTTIDTRTQVKWQQPDGPTVEEPVWCRDCNYDPDGSRTLRAQTQNGVFSGEKFELTRDGKGRVTSRRDFDAVSGNIQVEEEIGPNGMTEQTYYQNGKACAPNRIFYDAFGYATERINVDCDGKQNYRTSTRFNKDGQWLEETHWNANDIMTFHQTYDPATDQQRFTTYDDAGAADLAWTFRGGKVLSYWQRDDSLESPRQFGDAFSDSKDNGDAEAYRCHVDGQCDQSHVHHEYLSEGKRNPTSIEWRNAKGDLVVAAYYEYQLDAHQNWTSRKVEVWSPELGARTLAETDTRVIEYWDR